MELVPHSKKTERETELSLTALAMSSGNLNRAVRMLDSAGISITRATLSVWKRETYAERYAQIREEILPILNAELAEGHDDLVQGYSEIQREAQAKVLEHLPDATLREASSVAKDAAVGMGINTEKAQLRRGQPTQIARRDDSTEILKILAEKFPNIVQVDATLVEAEAVEIKDENVAVTEGDELHE